MTFLEVSQAKIILAQLTELGVPDSALKNARAFVSLCEKVCYEELNQQISKELADVAI